MTPSHLPRLCFVGPGRSGKGEACLYLSQHYGFRYTFGTSWVISVEIARREGTTPEAAHAMRHERRDLWRQVGDEMRQDDPARLARECLAAGDLVEGSRARPEIEAVIAEGLVSLVVWIHNPESPPDPTLEFGTEMADTIIENRYSWGLLPLHRRLGRLVEPMGARRIS